MSTTPPVQPLSRGFAEAVGEAYRRAELSPKVQGSYLAIGEIEQQLSDVARFLVHLDDACF